MDKEYFIEINGRQIPVSKEVYYAFKRPAWRERKRRQVRAEKELSLEAFADAGFEIPSGQALVDEIVEDKLLLDMLSKALSELTDEERFLIDELFFNDKSEREIAREAGVSQPAIHKRRNRILEN
ncbi:MAG: sigma-70 family RNA polymerase sigma factor [Anaerovoracaceae bacterium]|jgi:RNA polymerase sigma factor (sigma-70 family)